MRRFNTLILILLLPLYCSSQSENLLPDSLRPRIGLVLSGGGAKGLAHIGVLKVLDEIGLKPDYIAGTSMGSIVGGLYALGWPADSLEKLVGEQNWIQLMADKIPRRSLAFEEKEDEGRLYIPFPYQNGALELPSGLIAGHKLSALLNKLTWSAKEVDDFYKLPIPFLCIAADIERGKPVVLDTGSLSESLRASMAIPGVFTPVEIDSFLFVDGGLFNNFPVPEVEDMGADIVIGVNVSFTPYDKEQLKRSLVKINEQSMFIQASEYNNRVKKLCDYLITPNLDGGASSFNEAKKFIDSGEKAAREIYPQLKALADTIAKYKRTQIQSSVGDNKNIEVKRVIFEGVNPISADYLKRKMQLTTPLNLSLSEIDNAITKAWGTNLFYRVTYRFQPYEDKYALVISAIEKPSDLLRFGAHYDSDIKTNVVLAASFRNVLIKGSKLKVDLKVGDYQYFGASYITTSGWQPRSRKGWASNIKANLLFSLKSRQHPLYTFSQGVKNSSYIYNGSIGSLQGQLVFFDTHALGVGVEYEAASTKGQVNPIRPGTHYDYYTSIVGSFKVDTYNKQAFPTRGANAYAEIRYVFPDFSNGSKSQFYNLLLKYHRAIPISKRLTLGYSICGGSSFGDTIPFTHRFYYGGGANSSQIINGAFPFMGLNFMEQSDKSVIVGQLELQQRIWKDIYGLAKCNIARSKTSLDRLINNFDKFKFGYGLTAGFDSPFGPIELTASYSNKTTGMLFYINLGYWL